MKKKKQMLMFAYSVILLVGLWLFLPQMINFSNIIQGVSTKIIDSNLLFLGFALTLFGVIKIKYS